MTENIKYDYLSVSWYEWSESTKNKKDNNFFTCFIWMINEDFKLFYNAWFRNLYFLIIISSLSEFDLIL